MDDKTIASPIPSLSTPPPPTKRPRNAAIELLRVICTFLIIYRHFLYSGVIENLTGFNEVLCKLLYVAFYPAVDVYVVISSYFISQKMSEDWQWGKMIKLYIHTALVGWVAYLALVPTGYVPYSDLLLHAAIFPILGEEFWFFTAYIILLLAAPLVNMVLKRLSRKRHLFLCIVILVVSQFTIKGASGLWFILLYVITAYLSKYNIEFKTNRSLFVGFLLYCAAFAASYFIPWSHIYLTTVYMAFFLFLLFKRIHIKSAALSKIICIISSTTYGVYIIHCAPALQMYMYEGIFHLSTFVTSKFIFLILLGFSAVTFAACFVLDIIRQMLFKAVEILYAKTLKGKLKPPAFLVRLNNALDAHFASGTVSAAVADANVVEQAPSEMPITDERQIETVASDITDAPLPSADDADVTSSTV